MIAASILECKIIEKNHSIGLGLILNRDRAVLVFGKTFTVVPARVVTVAKSNVPACHGQQVFGGQSLATVGNRQERVGKSRRNFPTVVKLFATRIGQVICT